MIAALPYASLDPLSVDLAPFCVDGKARLTYPGFEDVTFLTPPLPFLYYDEPTARIVFDVSSQRAFATMLTALQGRIASFLPKKDVPLLPLYSRDKGTLTLFTPASMTLQRNDGTLAPLQAQIGAPVRCVVRLTSVCHHASNTYRIQHSIIKLFITSI